MSSKHCNFLPFQSPETFWQFAKSIYSFKLKFCAQKLVENASLIFREKEFLYFIIIWTWYWNWNTFTQRVQKEQPALPIGGKNTWEATCFVQLLSHFKPDLGDPSKQWQTSLIKNLFLSNKKFCLVFPGPDPLFYTFLMPGNCLSPQVLKESVFETSTLVS